jgi:gamma-glutamylcyclotransferase (GGCT)/AIG2-like uncharacterized protein YtfP
LAGGVRLFVYGTLMRGEAYHHRLMEQRPFLGKAKTEAAFELVDLGEYPGLVAGGATAVVGELFEMDAATLKVVDQLEGHPHLYQRTEIRLEDGSMALAYLLPAAARGRYPVIPGGDWRQFQRRGAP